MRRAVRLLLGLITVAGVLFLFVFPVRTLIDQRHQTGLAERRVQALAAENARLAKQAQQLQTPSYLKGIASHVYGLTAPHQGEVIVLPPGASGATTSTTTTTTLP